MDGADGYWLLGPLMQGIRGQKLGLSRLVPSHRHWSDAVTLDIDFTSKVI